MTSRSLIFAAILAATLPAIAAAAFRITYRDVTGVERVVFAKTGRIEVDDTIFRQGFE